MKYISLLNTEIPYKIAKKKNKNTYFYFKREGYIQINLSKYQSERDAVKYIKENSFRFINKLKNSTKSIDEDDSLFKLLGENYKVVLNDVEVIQIDEEKNTIDLPTTDIKDEVIKQFYKMKMMDVIYYLHSKYQNNKYIDLSNIKYKTRYTNTRHGSCNATKKTINLNLHLIKYELKYIEYVYLHEIAHLIHQNHSSKYYQLLEKICPNFKQLRFELKRIYR
ncbi:hypothetical protein KQ51_01635 [Candidatus Izimaplasma bacterium HR1]|jgi:predicted metal-dependent hydrolase|uniref:M48 family metallopeptidase n=1 Tax=Candidatus Izimoplasma sp. HR1 TaxID=1541959 RepID=UPI0004F64DFB|nr:hypothetical protein KQ51_01635 [Candidatus Izimaplasma bacterium HR1]